MQEWATDHYNLLKSLHIIAVISWMCGQLYLPRLFVYHCGVSVGSEAYDMLKTMERKLMRVIMNPAMITTYVFGLMLMSAGAYHKAGWFHMKFMLVLFLSASHGFMSKQRKRFEKGECRYTHKFWRIFNEVQTVLMIAIVFLVVYKPF